MLHYISYFVNILSAPHSQNQAWLGTYYCVSFIAINQFDWLTSIRRKMDFFNLITSLWNWEQNWICCSHSILLFSSVAWKTSTEITLKERFWKAFKNFSPTVFSESFIRLKSYSEILLLAMLAIRFANSVR